jgi:exosortase K
VSWLPAPQRRWLYDQRWRLAALAVAAAVLALGKEYYRSATAADLRWILAPTSRLVSWLSGHDFIYEAGQGWMNTDVMFVIAPACAGINFALAAFLALVLGSCSGMTSWRSAAKRLVRAAALAYAATLVVNTTRIVIALAMHRGTLQISGDRAELHRIEGIVVYLGGLCALYALARALETGRKQLSFAIPVVAYLVVTLALPLANGAAARADFARHAAWVVSACVVVVLLGVAVERARSFARRQT